VDKKRPTGSNQSFPSGHTSAVFQGAAFIHKRYGLKQAAAAYIGATFVGYSRVESDKHFTEDVIAGAALGIAYKPSGLISRCPTTSILFVHTYPDNPAGTLDIASVVSIPLLN